MLLIEILKLIPKMLIEFKQCTPLTIYLDMHSQLENVKPAPESGLLSEKVIFGGAHLGFVIISIAAASSAFSCARQSFAAGQPHIAYFHIWTNLTRGRVEGGGGKGPNNAFFKKKSYIGDPPRPPPPT